MNCLVETMCELSFLLKYGLNFLSNPERFTKIQPRCQILDFCRLKQFFLSKILFFCYIRTMKSKILYLLIMWSTLLMACKQTGTNSTATTPSVDEDTTTEVTDSSNDIVEDIGNQDVSELSSEQLKRIIGQRARAVLQLIAKKNFSELAQKYVHPGKGVRFSPYTYVEVEEDMVLSKAELETAWADTSIHQWGFEDGIGDPIEQTFKEYYSKYIYNKDFLSAKKIGYNTIIGKGNTINNRRDVYTDAIIVEYHDAGSEQYGGMDWGSLSLAFEKKDNEWLLVAIIHSQWTI